MSGVDRENDRIVEKAESFVRYTIGIARRHGYRSTQPSHHVDDVLRPSCR